MPFRFVGFDLGNVLLNIDLSGVGQELARYLGGDLTSDAVIRLSRQHGYAVGGIGTDDFYVQLRRMGFIGTLDQFLSAWNSGFSWVPGAAALVAEVHERNRTVVLSDNNPAHWGYINHEQPDLMMGFDAAYLSYVLGCCKNSLKFFELVEAREQASGDQCLLIDDLAANCALAETRGWVTIRHRDLATTRRQLVELGVLSAEVW